MNHSQAFQSSPVWSISKKRQKNWTGLDFKALMLTMTTWDDCGNIQGRQQQWCSTITRMIMATATTRTTTPNTSTSTCWGSWCKGHSGSLCMPVLATTAMLPPHYVTPWSERLKIKWVLGVESVLPRHVKSGSTPVGGPVKSGRRQMKDKSRGLDKRLVRPELVTAWIQWLRATSIDPLHRFRSRGER